MTLELELHPAADFAPTFSATGCDGPRRLTRIELGQTPDFSAGGALCFDVDLPAAGSTSSSTPRCRAGSTVSRWPA